MSVSTEDSVKTALRETSESFSHKNISEAGESENKKFKEYEHMFRDNFSLLSDNNSRVQEDLKSFKNYRAFDPREDAGYFVVFEHINEAAELFFKKASHSVIAEVLGDKMQKVPCFVGFEDLQKVNSNFQKNLISHLMTSQLGISSLKSLDLI